MIIQDLHIENPTYEVKGIFESLNENEEVEFLFLEIHFQENGEGTIHSRFWVVETNNLETEINKIEELKNLVTL